MVFVTNLTILVEKMFVYCICITSHCVWFCVLLHSFSFCGLFFWFVEESAYEAYTFFWLFVHTACEVWQIQVHSIHIIYIPFYFSAEKFCCCWFHVLVQTPCTKKSLNIITMGKIRCRTQNVIINIIVSVKIIWFSDLVDMHQVVHSIGSEYLPFWDKCDSKFKCFWEVCLLLVFVFGNWCFLWFLSNYLDVCKVELRISTFCFDGNKYVNFLMIVQLWN